LATKNLKEDRVDKDIIEYVHTDLKTKIFEELLDKTEAEDYVKQQIALWKKITYKIDGNYNYLYQCGAT
tara:strand:- start:381 stop:587 length:207 start_codon:yes stop_codon:yes gene_type:complete